LESSKAFRSYPLATASCVTLADDTNEETGCKQCTAHSLKYTLFPFSSEVVGKIDSGSVCKLTSLDGLTTVFCSQELGGNYPKVSYSCYQGRFSAETPLQPTVKKNYLLFT
jgi:hypothetical protein